MPAVFEVYNEGKMPNTDFTYEEFEGLLANCYLSFTDKRVSREDFKKATEILKGFAERKKVQPPENTLENPRVPRLRSYALNEGSYSEILDALGAFWHDFNVGGEPYTKDREERDKLIEIARKYSS